MCIRLGVKMYLTIKETINPVQIAATTVPSQPFDVSGHYERQYCCRSNQTYVKCNFQMTEISSPSA